MSDVIIEDTSGDALVDAEKPVSQPASIASTQQPEKILQVALNVFTGVPLKPEIKDQLNKQLEELKVGQQRFLWVLINAGTMEVLVKPNTKEVAENPRECGYKPVDHPWLSLAMKGVAIGARVLFNATIQEDGSFMLPNGKQFSCVVTSWRNFVGVPVRLMEVCQLDSGEWFEVTAHKSQDVHPFEDKTKLREALDKEIDKLEKAGYTREPVAKETKPPAPEEQTAAKDNPFASEPTFNIKA